ncbi:hypothetical protein VR41_12620 [Streptomyces sp. NRRL B-1568]|nr:hypothetical protein VR41_12620 [Streptomyces sp. NRRL B-1568]
MDVDGTDVDPGAPVPFRGADEQQLIRAQRQAVGGCLQHGKTWRLKNSDIWGSTADVNATYTVDASAVRAKGVWKLKVQDVYAGDSGYLSKWRLTFWPDRSRPWTRCRPG